jgi:hypothetical protein
MVKVSAVKARRLYSWITLLKRGVPVRRIYWVGHKLRRRFGAKPTNTLSRGRLKKVFYRDSLHYSDTTDTRPKTRGLLLIHSPISWFSEVSPFPPYRLFNICQVILITSSASPQYGSIK